MLDKIRPTAIIFGLILGGIAYIISDIDAKILPPEFISGIIGVIVGALGQALIHLVKDDHHHH